MTTTLPISERLENFRIFQELSLEEVDSLSGGIFVRRLPAATVVYRPEDRGFGVFVLLEGQIDLYRLTPWGKRLVTRRLQPGAIFGEVALLGQISQRGFAEAVEDSLVCMISQDGMFRIVSERPEVAGRVLRAAYNHMEELEERLEHASFSPVRVRLAHFLLAKLEPETGVVSGYTQADIGDMIGALRQTVTETLAGLRRLGMVEVGHKRISVLKVRALEELALGS